MDKLQYIDGQWVEAVNKKTWDVINPATEEIIETVSFADRLDFELCSISSQKAFESWSKIAPVERSKFLKKVSNNILENLQKLSSDTMAETGKPYVEAEAEWTVSAALFEWYAEEARRNIGSIVQSNNVNKKSHVYRTPIGVVGLITAWNFPAYNPSRAAAAALAAGCAVILKGSEFTPMSSYNLALMIDKAGLPPGVFNMLNGDAITIGLGMMECFNIKKISFTGSTRVGRILMNGASKTHTKLSLELGGNAPVIFDKELEVYKMAEDAVRTKMRNSGQTCICPQRFIVHSSQIEAYKIALCKEFKKLTTGINSKEAKLLGPVINERQRNSIMKILEEATDQGADVIQVGEVPSSGFFIPPTLIIADKDMPFVEKEIFGPVMVLIPYETWPEALAIANETEYGLAAYGFTNSLHRTYDLSEKLEFGIIGINEWAPHGTELPFSGWKQSGVGIESGAEGMQEYLETKLVSVGIY
jgi:acyl-CoA reductase-like NAD-dependent aldehyde dehydrogenase